MATFGDIMSLLLCFFVLILSFANMDVIKFRALAGSLNAAFGGARMASLGAFDTHSSSPIAISETITAEKFSPVDVARPSARDEGANRTYSDDQAIIEVMKQKIDEQNLEKIVDLDLTERGVTIRVQGQLLYKSGDAELLPESHMFLDAIVEITKQFSFNVRIEGHTDDVSINTERYPTNWHLSSARAIAALRYLMEAGGIEPERLSAAGYANMHPIVPNDSPENRATNRRVEFVYYRVIDAPSPKSPNQALELLRQEIRGQSESPLRR